MWRCGEVCLVRRRGVFLYATFFRCMVCMWSSSFGICIPFSNSPIKRGRVINIILPSSQKAITKIRVRPCYIKKKKINRKKKVERKREIASYLVCILAVCTLFVLSQNACIFYRYFAVQDCRKVFYVLGHLRYTSGNIFPTGTTHPNGHRSLLKRFQKNCL